MLNKLSIQNYALINSLNIEFEEGLNIITGETGAGKSILLGALSLILGQRIESKYFFNQQKKCIIEGFFKIKDVALKDFFDQNDLDFEHETILRREISADGKSRAFINDTPVNLQTLKQLGENLIDIHSQHAMLEIKDEKFQLMVVDVIAGNKKLLEEYKSGFQAYKKQVALLNQLRIESAKAKADADYFQFQFDELEAASLTSGEQEQIEEELNIQTHAEDIKRNLSSAISLLDDNEFAALTQIKVALQNLQQSEKFKPEIKDQAERLLSVHIELKDIIAELSSLEQSTVVDPDRSAALAERLNLIFSLQKKHQVNTVEGLLSLQTDLSDKLFNISNSDEIINQLSLELEKAKSSLMKLATTLSQARQKAIPTIEKLVVQNLEKVGMTSTQFKIENTIMSVDDFDMQGIDQIKFLFSANKGQAPAPMNKVASGGELSRLMLTIKSLIAKSTTLPTIIFDEIDTGISGETALKVGKAMEKLGDDLQVIAITHLPQIASKGTSHYQVYKEQTGAVTNTGIRRLGVDARISELATMLSGAKPGESAIQNAKELLSL